MTRDLACDIAGIASVALITVAALWLPAILQI